MFPYNEVGDKMIASLQADGVQEIILAGHPQRSFDLEGAYRHVVVRKRPGPRQHAVRG